jgi:hypothetical protein
VQDARLPEDSSTHAESLVVCSWVLDQRVQVSALAVKQRKKEDWQRREDDIVDGSGDRLYKGLARETVEDLKVHEDKRKAAVLVE